ncbi:MAG: trigger factor [Fusobacteriota bacterium]
MNYEVNELNDVKLEIKLTVEGDDLQGKKSKIVNGITKEADIKGFRKGKAPKKVIEKKYKQDIEKQLVEEIVNENYPKIIKDEEIKPVNYPQVTNADIKEDNVTLTMEVEIYPEVSLGEYKGLEIEKDNYELKEEDLKTELDSLVERNSKLKEAPEGAKAKEGDTAVIDFEGFIDGEAFEGGKAEGHELKLGSNSFIGDFEKQIEGHEVGDEFDVKVTFPENYGKEELAGKEATFKVKLNAIKVLETPELDDDFAKEVGYDTFEDLKEAKEIEIQKRENDKIEKGFINTILEEIKKGSEVTIPESLIKRETQQRLKEMEQQLKSQGMTLEMYLQMSNMTKDKLIKDLEPVAEEKIKMDLILERIAKEEDVQVTEEEIEEKIAEVANHYKMEVEKLKQQLKENGNYNNFLESLKFEKITKKTVDLIVSETIEK